jgi:hypothetical protein
MRRSFKTKAGFAEVRDFTAKGSVIQSHDASVCASSGASDPAPAIARASVPSGQCKLICRRLILVPSSHGDPCISVPSIDALSMGTGAGGDRHEESLSVRLR